jgi:hypothetical protein
VLFRSIKSIKFYGLVNLLFYFILKHYAAKCDFSEF